MKYQAQLFAEQKITVLEFVLFPQSWTEAANYVVSYKMMMSAMKLPIGCISVPLTDCRKNVSSNQVWLWNKIEISKARSDTE